LAPFSYLVLIKSEKWINTVYFLMTKVVMMYGNYLAGRT
jgi:hypothetical protein